MVIYLCRLSFVYALGYRNDDGIDLEVAEFQRLARGPPSRSVLYAGTPYKRRAALVVEAPHERSHTKYSARGAWLRTASRTGTKF